MVSVSIENGFVNFDVQGLDKLWSFRSRLSIPIEHIRSAMVDAEAARGWWHGLRLMGTSVPGILTAGSFYEHGGMVFYDVHDPDNTVVIDVDHERYQKIIVEVEDPEKTVRELETALTKSK